MEATDEIRIRDSLYGELGSVADVILESFYADAKPPWNYMYRLAELNRLQQGFPYADDRELHRMLVAVHRKSTGEDEIVGFCDIDARKPNQSTAYKYNPRPYLSDLCVAPSVRRRGVARSLVKECEEFSRRLAQRKRQEESAALAEIYIRVERTNEAAVKMYTEMGYQEIENHLDDSEKIIILRKQFEL